MSHNITSMTLKNVSLFFKGELTPRGQSSLCYYRPSYLVRKLKNRGALLTLLWSFLVTGVFNFYFKQNNGVVLNIQLVAGGLTLPIAGWLADVYFGRYKVIHMSIWIMWISITLATASSVVAELVESYSSISKYITGALIITSVIGFGGFQANNIQFGVDQLCCASTTEISAYISWYIWCSYSSEFLVDCTLRVLNCIHLQTHVLGNLVICVQLSAALCSVMLFNHWLVKEPITQNPFKLIYSIVRYALQHKHPRFRSAFTYCEDELPSRIDFGKSKYGGPFTTEQVEDVKTFFRMLVVGSFVCILLGIVVSLFMLKEEISSLLINRHSIDKRCYSEELTQQIFNYSWVVIIPLYEFILYPLFSRCLAEFSYRSKFTLGVVLHTVTILAFMLIMIIARHNSLEHYDHTSSHKNVTLECILYEGNDALTLNLDSRWMVVPNFLYSISVAVLGISSIEFGISQAPYSMRGLIMGTAYGMIALAAALTVAVSVPFMKRFDSIVWGTGIISCEFWYTLMLLIIETIVGVTLIAAMKWYKKRKREDVLPSEHIFAERYYAED